MTLEQRIAAEKRIVKAAVKGLLAAGFRLAVDNGGDELEVNPTFNQKDILAGLFHCDEERILVFPEGGIHQANEYMGWVWLVYGNDGYDVICDYSTNLEGYLTEAAAIADKIESAA